jgi:hypothetical protein
MASVQAPPAVQPLGAPLPAGATKQQAEEVFSVCTLRVHQLLTSLLYFILGIVAMANPLDRNLSK